MHLAVFLLKPQELWKTVYQNDRHRFGVLGLCWWGDAGWIIPILVLEAIVKKEHWDSWEHPGSFQTCGRSRQGHLAQESISQQEHMKGTSMALSRAETPYQNLGSLISGRPSEITEMGFPPSPGTDTI